MWTTSCGQAYVLAAMVEQQKNHNPPLPEIPTKYHSDSVVVPDELSTEYETLLQSPDMFDWADPLAARSIPLEFRRAAVYERCSQMPQLRSKEDPTHRYIFLRSFADSADDLLVKAKAAGAASNLTVTDRQYIAADRCYIFTFDAQHALRNGEYAWLADQLLAYAPMHFHYVLIPQIEE
jgi:hypothetical protein